MIPIELIIAGGSVALAALSSLFFLYRPRAKLSEEELARQEEERLHEAARRREIERLRALQAEHDRAAEEHRRAAEERQRAEEEARKRAENERQLSGIVNEVIGHVPFTARRVQVGVRKTGQRAVGVRVEETPFPADDVDLRPIHNMGELPNLLPAELAQPHELLMARIATGQALVETDLQHTPVYEDVFEPIWEERRMVLYVLRDRSGSMSGRGQGSEAGVWRIPAWRAIISGLVRRARQVESLFLMRDFTDRVFDPFRALSDEDAEHLVRFLYANLTDGGTDIAKAIDAAIGDLAREKYDQAVIVIVTDGEDQAGMDPDKVRERLKAANIQLYAILLGVNNDALRACANVYQVIRPDLTFEPPVRRAS